MKKILKPMYYFILKKIPVERRVKFNYYRVYKRWPNLSNPTSFNEKVLCRILFDKKPIYSMLADKYAVRDFIKNRIGEEVLIPLLLVTENADELKKLKDWSQIVIKPNHAAGFIKIFDTSPTEKIKIKTMDEAKKWLSIDFSQICDEWHYSLIKPKLLVERKITKAGVIPRDYKFHCFRQEDGTIKYVLQLVDGRFGIESRGYYLNSLDDCVWHHGGDKYELTDSEKQVLKIAIELNKKIILDDFNYIRIDWYIVDKKLYFGEITLTPGAGRANEFGPKLEKLMGQWWCL